MLLGSSDRAAPRSRRRRALLHCSLLALLAPAAASSAFGAERATRPVILVVGDSLSAEYGIERGSGWVALLERRLQSRQLGYDVVNASISGDTTAGGRSRLPALLTRHQPAVVVIELGGNDALRGLPLASTRANLEAMTRAAQDAGARVVVVGMQVPPNYGRRYAEDFAAIFPEVAARTKAALVPFMLEGLTDAADVETNFQPDRIHPRAVAHPRILDNIWPRLQPLLRAGA